MRRLRASQLRTRLNLFSKRGAQDAPRLCAQARARECDETHVELRELRDGKVADLLTTQSALLALLRQRHEAVAASKGTFGRSSAAGSTRFKSQKRPFSRGRALWLKSVAYLAYPLNLLRHCRSREQLAVLRRNLVGLFVMLLSLCYMPLLQTSLQPKLCEDNGGELFMTDSMAADIVCDPSNYNVGTKYGLLNLLSNLSLLVYGAGIPSACSPSSSSARTRR